MKLLCKLFGHKFYSPIDHFDIVVGDKKQFVKDNPYVCLRCGIRK